MTRKQYVSAIWVYENRRNRLRSRFEKWKKDKRYTELCYNLTKKISTWKAAIRRIDKRKSKIIMLIRQVNEFFDLDIKSRKQTIKYRLARNIYYKIGMEQDISSTYLALYIGRSKMGTSCTRGRRSLQKSFEANNYNKKMYYQFKDFINENKICSSVKIKTA